MQISKDMEYDLVKIYNSFYQKEEKNNTIIFNSKFDKKVDNNIENIIRENSKERNEKNESNNFNQYNEMISYFYSTAQYLKHSNEYNSIHLSMLNSKNYIPKIVFQKKQYKEEYENYNTKKDDFIYNKKDNNFNFNNFEQKVNEDNNKVFLNNKYINRNYLSNENALLNIKIGNDLIYNNPPCINIDEEKNISNGSYKLFDNNKNYPIFIPSKYKKKQNKNSPINSNYSEKTEPTSSVSEKGENKSNFTYHKNGKNLPQKNNEDEYLTQMFGKMGWICALCNNFNYQSRNKCNRCGALKKPKKILNADNTKNSWICMNCKNFNNPFNNVCSRCKAFRINKTICCPLYSLISSFNILNIIFNTNKQFK
jgi:hypothetical protein